jgi:hypothetical protein
MRALSTLHASDFLSVSQKPGGAVMIKKLNATQKNPEGEIKKDET